MLTFMVILSTMKMHLQEVEEYDSFFKRIMGAQGYSGIYIQKGEDHKRDGVAIFYKPKLYI